MEASTSWESLCLYIKENLVSVIQEREEFFVKCDCSEEHENKFVEGVFINEDKVQVEFSVALINHDEDRDIWLAIFLDGCKEVTNSHCMLTAHIYIKDSNVCFSIQDAERSPFKLAYENDLYCISREEALSVDGLKDALFYWYKSIFKTDKGIGLFLLVS